MRLERGDTTRVHKLWRQVIQEQIECWKMNQRAWYGSQDGFFFFSPPNVSSTINFLGSIYTEFCSDFNCNTCKWMAGLIHHGPELIAARID